MYQLGKVVMFTADDICDAFHVSKETAYRILSMPQAKTLELGRKKLIAEENLLNIFTTKTKI